jgi:superfamily II DNA or RNA helicase
MAINRECKIRLLDEVWAMVIGLSEDHLTFLYNKFSILSDNYFFNPRYKLGIWDGKIQFFQPTGKTYVYLIEEILPIIIKFGYKVVLEDKRTTNVAAPSKIDDKIFQHIPHIDTNLPIVLRQDQVDAVNRLIEGGNGICLAGTGCGKTLICSALVMAYSILNIKTLTIVPDGGLIRQTKAEYINCGLDTGEYSGTAKTLEHQHVVSTWQALKNNPKIVLMFQMVIVDECHGLRGNILQKILTQHAGAVPYRFGVTGTLPKSATERMAVHAAVGPVRHIMPAHTLIEMGVLANLHIDVLQLEEDLTEEYAQYLEEEKQITLNSKPPTYTQFKDSYFGDFTAEKSYLHRNEQRIEWIAELLLIKQASGKGNILCLVDSIPLGRQLAALIPGAMFVNGKDVKTPAKRAVYYDMFKDHDDLIMIATVHIAGTGLNIRRIFDLVMIDVGQSFIRVVQAIGRGLRKAEDKESVIITDICSDLKYSKKHMTVRTNYYKEQQYPFKKRKIEYTKMMTLDDTI